MGRFGSSYWQSAGSRPQFVQNAPYRCLAAQPYSILTNPTDNAYQFETLPGDYLSYEPDRTRAEITDILHGPIPYGTTFWRAWDFRIVSNPGPFAAATSGGWSIFGQFHQTAGPSDVAGASPIWAFYLQANGELALSTNGSTQIPLVNLHTSVIRAQTTGFVQSNWHRIVVYYNLDPVNGAIGWNLDGTWMCQLTGIQLGYASDLGPYDQLGHYTGPINANGPVVAQYANVQRSTTTSLASMIGPASPPFALI